MKENKIKDRIVKTDKGYFFDTEAGHYIKLTDEICDVIDAPESDYQEEGERWGLVGDLLEDLVNRPITLTPQDKSKEGTHENNNN